MHINHLIMHLSFCRRKTEKCNFVASHFVLCACSNFVELHRKSLFTLLESLLHASEVVCRWNWADWVVVAYV